jgi:5-bromo-4-chloroindolyl phosphate hydrolysis protein
MALRSLRWKVTPQMLDVASVGGATVVGGAAVLGGLPLALGVGAGAVTWAALRYLVLEPLDGSNKVVADGLYETDIAQILEGGRRQTAEIKALAKQILDVEAKKEVEGIVLVLETIFSHFEDHPKDVPGAQKFLAVYMERTRSIIRRYVDYQSVPSQRAAEVRRKVEKELLPTLKQLCEDQYEKFLDTDLRTYDTDVEVLKKTIRLENL